MYRRLLAASTIALLIGCTGEEKISSLDSRVKRLEDTIESLKLENQSLRSKIEGQELLQNFREIAYLTPNSVEYSIIDTVIGKLTVSLLNIQPYANGSKVTLRIGNLTTAHILGLKANIDWGTVDHQGNPNNSEARSREVSLGEMHSSGSWMNTDVVLDGIPPASLGFVRLHDVSHRGIRFRG